METAEVKKFNSVADFLEDEIFQGSVRKKIDDIVFKRDHREAPKAGLKYKRDWYDRFLEQAPFTYEFIINEIDKVMLKESKLSPEARQIIRFIYGDSMGETLMYYHNLKKEQEEVKS